MRILIACVVFVLGLPAWAQQVEIKDEPQKAQPQAPKTGQERAKEYFGERKREEGSSFKTAADAPSGESAPRFMAIHAGTFFSDQSYRWGDYSQEGIGRLNAGVDYRIGEWVNSMDLLVRMDFTAYGLDQGNARKISVSGLITFPDANSRFPLYFGGGLGPGFFVKQIAGESGLVLDYSLFGGIRFLNVYERVGFLIETGMKNHLHLLSDGQFNGVYINVGSAFAF